MSYLLPLLVVVAMGSSQTGAGVGPAAANGLPPLNVVRSATLGPSYSCRSSTEFAAGYAATALWLSDYSRRRNAPDLLFDGACGGENFFVASTAEGDMALIADLGLGVSLPSVSFEQAFRQGGGSAPGAGLVFAETAPVAVGHTYVVTLNKGDVRGAFALTVTRFDPDKRVDFNYVVLNYSVNAVVDRAT